MRSGFSLVERGGLLADAAGLQRGFSLVELSIVLVILGLLTGGILSGQSLIRAAELRSVTTEFSKYHTAVMTFRGKYFSLPGDMPDATRFWGSAGGDGQDSTCIAAQLPDGKATCNGNGDGSLYNNSTPSNMRHTSRLLAWKHLSNSGLIEGSYSGKTNGAAGTYDVSPGVNVPSSRMKNAYWDIYTGTQLVHYAEQTSDTILTIRGNNATISVFTPEEAWNIDSKTDDGKPATGLVVTSKASATEGPNCASSDAMDAEYNVQNNVVTCFLSFKFQNF